ncbi:MAG: spore germination protein [Hydrogenibacillus sp.]|nr:spore germination protein [Hydrogenibacillus sp.]
MSGTRKRRTDVSRTEHSVDAQTVRDERLIAVQKTLEGAQDVVERTLVDGDKTMELLYIKTIADEDKLERYFIRPFYEADGDIVADYLASLSIRTPYSTPEAAQDLVLNGHVLIVYRDQAALFDIRLALDVQVLPAENESTLQGPQNAFSQTLLVNLNLIRYRYRNPSLAVELAALGTKSRTNVALVYDRARVRRASLEIMRQKMRDEKVEALFATGQLERYFNPKKWTLFPTFMTTDRPDRVVYEINRGKIALIVDGTPFVFVAPGYFFDFFSAMEDLYHPAWVRTFFLTMRFLALLVTLITPGLYVALTAFNPGVFRVQLTLSIAGSRAAVPFSAFFEMLFMMIAIELLLEASVRLPKSISAAATTVGGLILGQAMTAAGLVSDVMLIVAAVVAISSFVVPINAMFYAVRIVRYPILLACTFYGLVGLGVALVALIFFLANKDSFGEPYFYLPFDKGTQEKGLGGA